MTETEKRMICALGDPLYTVEFLEEWTSRTDNVFINAPAALQIMGARGYYQAVRRMVQTVPQWDSEFETKECEMHKNNPSHSGTERENES